MADLSNLKIKDTDPASDALYDKVNAIADALNVEYKTNCVIEIPQDIKLELNNGTLTLKAGSKVYDGSGNVINISNDKTLSSVNASTRKTGMMVFYDTQNESLYYFNDAQMFSGATQPSSSEIGQYAVWYDTTNKVLKRTTDDGATWISGVSLPLCSFTAENNTILSLDETFNGVGYIGSTVFVLPNVVGLAPNGRNAYGTLKNKLVKTQNVVVFTEQNWTQHQYQFVQSNGTSLSVSSNSDYNYDAKNNFIKRNNGSIIDGFVISECDLNGGVISNFNSNKVFQALDNNYLPYLWSSGQTKTSDYSPSVIVEEGDGYIKFSSGVMIQWGVTTSNPIVFPRPFINTNYSVTYLSYAQVSDRNYSIDNSSKTTTSVSIYQWCTGSSWQAIGKWK